jgi:hypothetical protein
VRNQILTALRWLLATLFLPASQETASIMTKKLSLGLLVLAFAGWGLTLAGVASMQVNMPLLFPRRRRITHACRAHARRTPHAGAEAN